ncbi:MAG TPA: SUMF1/EgtB/PvdO family nonheme iron enzyme, partial [Polyangiaceae bacterium]
ASTFIMGSSERDIIAAVLDCRRSGAACSEETYANEVPLHTVKLAAYFLDRTEVTVTAYRRCVELRRCRAIAYDRGAQRFNRPDFPVTLVTHRDALDYCAFRGGRLPTEAEFERAARGVARRRFPWGNLYNSRVSNHGRAVPKVPDSSGAISDEPDDDLNDASDGFEELAKVGSFPAGKTPEGILDLAGNAAEWTSETYQGQYNISPASSLAGPPVLERVVRGGHYQSPPPSLRGAARGHAPPSAFRPTLGFRCARSAPPDQ